MSAGASHVPSRAWSTASHPSAAAVFPAVQHSHYIAAYVAQRQLLSGTLLTYSTPAPHRSAMERVHRARTQPNSIELAAKKRYAEVRNLEPSAMLLQQAAR